MRMARSSCKSIILLSIITSLLLAAAAWGKSFPSVSDPTLSAQQRWGAAGDGYVVTGCLHATSASTTVSVPACRGFALDTTAPQALKGFEETSARAVTFSAGDGTYWMGGRVHTGVTPGGWTAVAGTHYVWIVSATVPTVPSGVVLLSRSIVLAGAVTEVRGLFATNPHNPGRIYGTDPYVGMVCNGATDDSAALQRAIDLSTQRGGVGIELPAGTCVVRNVTIRNNLTPGGLDAADKRMGCASISGQGVAKTVLTPPDGAAATDYVLNMQCTPLGAGHFAPVYPGNYPGGSTLQDLTIYGRQDRQLETHGLIVQGGHARVVNVAIHSINGHGLWIGRDEKLESAWFANLHVRHSGRYIDDGGRRDGLPGSSNNAAIVFSSPADGVSRNNNISFYGLQVGFSWYMGIDFQCAPLFSSAVHFFGSMLHNNEDVDASNQGRLDSDHGLVGMDGACFDISFVSANVVVPGADAADTNDPAGLPAPAFLLGYGAGGNPTDIYLTNIYLNGSCCGQGVKILKASQVFITSLRGKSGDFPDGQLVVPSGAALSGLHICNSQIDAAATFVDMEHWPVLRDCGRQVYIQNVTSDATRAVGQSGGSWAIGAAATSQVRAHTLACTPTPRYIHVVHTDEPDACTELYLDAIDATNFTINCNVAPGGDGAAGEWHIDIPSGCGSALATLPQTPLMTSEHQRAFIHGIYWTSDNPGTTLDAANYAVLTLSKRKILSSVDFAVLTSQATNFPAWTDIPFVVTDTAELVWEGTDALTLRIEKQGTGTALNAGTLTVVIGTNVNANQ